MLPPLIKTLWLRGAAAWREDHVDKRRQKVWRAQRPFTPRVTFFSAPCRGGRKWRRRQRFRLPERERHQQQRRQQHERRRKKTEEDQPERVDGSGAARQKEEVRDFSQGEKPAAPREQREGADEDALAQQGFPGETASPGCSFSFW